jgi:hypothetical protein
LTLHRWISSTTSSTCGLIASTSSSTANRPRVPYFLTLAEQGKNPIELVAQAIDQLVPDAKGKTGFDLVSCLRNARVAVPDLYDQPLYATGFWSLLLSKLSVEAYHLVQDASRYFSVYT